MRIILLMLMLCLPIRAEDWIVKGKTYSGIKILKLEADIVTILDSNGGATLDLADMPSDLQKRLNYDPAKAKAAAKARIAATMAAEEDAKPDWQKVTDKFLVDLVPEVQAETDNASTPSEKIHATTDQNWLVIFHNLYAGKTLNENESKLLHDWISCVLHGQICVGMPREIVLMAWGNPDTDTTTTNGDGDDWESMTFGHWSSMVFVSGGFVKSISQTTAQD